LMFGCRRCSDNPIRAARILDGESEFTGLYASAKQIFFREKVSFK